jgi:hypothetical protein
MGQGYCAIILAEKSGKDELIRTWVYPHSYHNIGYKLMEHSYVGNNFVEAVESLISPTGMFYKSRLVWAGDYADVEPDSTNLYQLVDIAPNNEKGSRPNAPSMKRYPYVVNHSKQLFVKKKQGPFVIHPLPILTSEGNGLGGGDYNGTHMDLVGTWARDTISVDDAIPDGYTELVCEFKESH